MNARRPRELGAVLANHQVMGVYGMLVGLMATAQPALLALCATRPPPGSLLSLVSTHLREHLAMFVGMAIGNLVSIAVASRNHRAENGWRQETWRGARCFALMAVGMVVGSMLVGGSGIAVLLALGIPQASLAMLAGIGFGALAERLCEKGSHRPRARARQGFARSAVGALAR